MVAYSCHWSPYNIADKLTKVIYSTETNSKNILSKRSHKTRSQCDLHWSKPKVYYIIKGFIHAE